MGVIEEVKGQPTEWLSETVLIPKAGTKEIRMCTDMKAANTAISREKYEMPNMESIIHKAHGMKSFSKIDLKAAFEQIELDPDCRYISRFRTHLGIFQHTRLFFGVNSAPEIFHNIIRSLLAGIDNVINATDDILIMGKDDVENRKAVRQVLERLRDNNLTAKELKCEFEKKRITFFGLEFSEDGVSLSNLKTQALKNFASPASKAELHSFLALANYASRWI